MKNKNLFKKEVDIYNLAVERYVYWAKRKDLLKKLINQLLGEVDSLDKVDLTKIKKYLKEKVSKVKAVWVLSGTGTFDRPLTDTPGDQIYKGRTWAYYSDQDRIKLAIELINYLSQAVAKDQKISVMDAIREYGSYLVYNGVGEQQIAIKRAIKSGKLSFPKSKLYIPKGKIIKTLDQVKNLRFPEKKYQFGDILVIVTHVAHYPRVLRMLNKYKKVFGNLSIVIYPAQFKTRKGFYEFAFNEIMGVLGYIALGEATVKPCKYLK